MLKSYSNKQRESGEIGWECLRLESPLITTRTLQTGAAHIVSSSISRLFAGEELPHSVDLGAHGYYLGTRITLEHKSYIVVIQADDGTLSNSRSALYSTTGELMATSNSTAPVDVIKLSKFRGHSDQVIDTRQLEKLSLEIAHLTGASLLENHRLPEIVRNLTGRELTAALLGENQLGRLMRYHQTGEPFPQEQFVTLMRESLRHGNIANVEALLRTPPASRKIEVKDILSIGESLETAGNLKIAEQLYKESYGQFPQEQQFYLAAGKLALKQGDTGAAFRHFVRGLMVENRGDFTRELRAVDRNLFLNANKILLGLTSVKLPIASIEDTFKNLEVGLPIILALKKFALRQPIINSIPLRGRKAEIANSLTDLPQKAA